ncbi:MAG TPA: hypothetical protein VL907_04885 [Pyrinomonadaceae bacterium]|nr:hypothetical protein [Pyrinomonadaceae bacterium]
MALSFTCVYAQAEKKTEPVAEEKQPITMVLKTGPLLVDEVTEDADGYWYKRGNVSTFIDRERVVRIEHPKPPAAEENADDVVEGAGKWKLTDAGKIEEFFLAKYKKPLPLSAFGQSDLHTRWGWDHRNGMDIGLHPDSLEGRGLIEFLRTESIPFLAFRSAVPGVATGPHIHIGNRSPRISSRR